MDSVVSVLGPVVHQQSVYRVAVEQAALNESLYENVAPVAPVELVGDVLVGQLPDVPDRRFAARQVPE
jgi:hypothetical protein